MDGTLVDSSKIITNSINYVRSKLGLKPMEKQLVLEAINDTSIHRAKFFYGVNEYEPQHITWFREYYANNHHKETALYPGIKDLLKSLKPHYNLAIATNAYRQSAELILEHLQIKDYFDTTICGDEVANPKPAADMIEKIIDLFGCKRDEIILIGDGKTDEEAAQNADIGFIRVNWGWQKDEDGVKSVEELKEILLTLHSSHHKVIPKSS